MPEPTYQLAIPCTPGQRNPMGYKRVLNHSMRDDGVKYLEWQQYVRAIFFDRTQISRTLGTVFIAPIEMAPHQKAFMLARINFVNEAHADGDNVWKGLADSLFVNDKHLDGYFTTGHVTGLGCVHISIYIVDREKAETPVPLWDDLIYAQHGPRSLQNGGVSRDEGIG